MRTRLHPLAQLTWLIFAVSAAVACSNAHQAAEPAAPANSHADSSTAQPSVGSLADAGPDRKTRVPDPDAVAISLTNITVNRQGDHDQAVFAFTGTSIPGWDVHYVDRAVQNGTGQILPIEGQSLIEVLIRETPGPFGTAEKYTGPSAVPGQDTTNINAVHYSAAGRGMTQAFISLNKPESAFTVSALSNPTRIVVDVAG